MKGKISRLPCDDWYSKYVRKKDGRCTRCGSPVRFNDKGDPVSHHASHFYGRRRWSVRFDDSNVTTHCHGCHSFLTANPKIHEEWKKQQLGEKEFDLLTIRANTTGKRDPKMALIVAKGLLDGLKEK